jgi:DNA-binding FrmR family transcriptional regulator
MKSHTHSRTERDAQKLRVRRIVGQMNAIERMLEEDRDCAEILMPREKPSSPCRRT